MAEVGAITQPVEPISKPPPTWGGGGSSKAPTQSTAPSSGFTPGPSTNPWSVRLGQDQQAQMQGTQAANQNISQMQGQMASYAGDANAYPAMANSYGIGQQPQAVPGQASNPSFQAQPLTQTMPDSGSRGFNPWSLAGESNSRGN